MDTMLDLIEKIVERALWESRFMIFLAVVSSILSAFVLILMGTYDVGLVIKEVFHAFGDKETYAAFHSEAITHIISAIDSYLIATVLLIFGIGLYELFISKIDFIETDSQSSKILEIHSLDQLKEKLAKVIIMVLIVTFFKHALDMEYTTILDLLYLAIGIVLISLASYLMHKSEDGKKDKVKAGFD